MPLLAVADWLGRKAAMLLVTLVALVAVGLTDKSAAEAIGWCVVGAYGIFAGANSAITTLANRNPTGTAVNQGEAR